MCCNATADLPQTFANVKALLAPGGQLILLEGVQPVPWVDLVFGLTPGWWRFTDTALRRDHPLICTDQWKTLLASAGFDAVESLRPEFEGDLEISQSVLIAQTHKLAQKRWGFMRRGVGCKFDSGPAARTRSAI